MISMRTIIFRPETPASSNLLEFRVNKMGIHENMPPQIIHRPAGNIDYLFMLFHSPALIRVGEKTREYPGDSMMIWEPGQSHYYGHDGLTWDHSWFHCEGTVVRARMGRTSLPLNRPFPLSDAAVVDNYLMALHSEITSHLSPDAEIQRGLFTIWVREMERQADSGSTGSMPGRFIDVKRYIESHFHEPIRLKRLAEIACVSVPYFCSVFKKYFGFSALDYVVSLRVQHAAFLLGDVNMNVTDVAEAVGYDDLYYFSKLFKKHHGVSPRSYRRKLGGERASGRPRDV
jgi:AraC family transcriptional regulator of arabinose operon